MFKQWIMDNRQLTSFLGEKIEIKDIVFFYFLRERRQRLISAYVQTEPN